MKKYLAFFITLILCFSMCFAACDEIPSGSGSSGGSGSSSDDDIISAVVEEDSDFVPPTIYNLSSSYFMPTLTDEEMKEVVFTLSEKHYFETEPIPDIADRGHEYGRVYLYEDGFYEEQSDYYYIIDGITTNIETSDEYDKYRIYYNSVYYAAYFASANKSVNNSYWQQYFDVMFDNVEFSEVELLTDNIHTELYSYDADIWTWVSGGGATYYFYGDGTLRKVSDNTLYVADRKVDSPKVFMVSLLFYIIDQNHSTDSYNGIMGVYADNVTFHYRGKNATVPLTELNKLLLGENRNVRLNDYRYDLDRLSFDTYNFYNEKYSVEGELIYLIEKNNVYTIDSTGSVYSYRSREGLNLETTHQHLLLYYANVIMKQSDVFDYDRLILLFS